MVPAHARRVAAMPWVTGKLRSVSNSAVLLRSTPKSRLPSHEFSHRARDGKRVSPTAYVLRFPTCLRARLGHCLHDSPTILPVNCETIPRWTRAEKSPPNSGCKGDESTLRARKCRRKGAAARRLRSYLAKRRSVKTRWRSGRDSNPRYGFAVYSLSRRAPSTTRPPLRMPVGREALGRGT